MTQAAKIARAEARMTRRRVAMGLAPDRAAFEVRTGRWRRACLAWRLRQAHAGVKP